ncbi:MAG: hypothetical protein GY938_25725 [Ketobacter sp.]|nr:hypothetical protein [Ketobacter sp.]
MEALTFTDWQEKIIIETVLPSGLGVRLREVAMEDLALSGVLPAELLVELSERDKKGESLSSTEMLSNMDKYGSLIDAIFWGAFDGVLVKTTKDDQGNEVNVYQPPNDKVRAALKDRVKDKLFVMNLVSQDVETVLPFPEGQEPGGDAASSVSGVQDSTE